MPRNATLPDDERLDETFAALANATRRAILDRLAEGEATVNDLAEPFDLSLPAISKHIKVLEEAGLISRGRRAQFRPCTIETERLAEVASWTERYRHIWEDRFDRMDHYVRDLQQTDNRKTQPPMTETKNVTIERTFDAPIDLIWSMWTEAEHFSQWYGPMGTKIPKAEMDVTIGGRRYIAMEMDTPNGAMQMFFVGEYREIDPKTRLVYTEAMADAGGNPISAEQMGMPAGASMETSVVVELEDLGDRTNMVMTHIGVPADSPGGQGWTMAIDKLEARVAELHADQ